MTDNNDMNSAADPVPVDVTRRDEPAASDNRDRRDPAARNVGRPVKYDETYIHQLAVDLEEWFLADPNNLFFEVFAASRGIHMRQCRRFCEASPEFASAWERCGCLQAARILEMSGRTQLTAKGQSFYSLNPRIGILILQAKHGYTQRMEIDVERSAKPSVIDTLRQRMPTDEGEARRWLERVAAGAGVSDDAKELQAGAEFLLGEYEMKDMVEVGSALCDF